MENIIGFSLTDIVAKLRILRYTSWKALEIHISCFHNFIISSLAVSVNAMRKVFIEKTSKTFLLF